MSISTIIFDFDGIILESVNLKTKAFAELFVDYPEHLNKIIKLHMENGGMSRFEKFKIIYRDFIKKPLSEEKSQELGQRFSEIVYNKVLKCPFVKGAKELLGCYLNRYAFFVVSGAPQNEICSIIDERGLRKYFKGVYGAPASKGTLIKNILQENSFQPHELVFIGDSINDYIGATEAGVKFVGRRLNSGFDLFKNSNCDAVVNDMDEFRMLLDEGKI